MHMGRMWGGVVLGECARGVATVCCEKIRGLNYLVSSFVFNSESCELYKRAEAPGLDVAVNKGGKLRFG
jgi:hypothetical protein